MSEPDPLLQPFLSQVNQSIALAKKDKVSLTPALMRANFSVMAALAGQGPTLEQVYDSQLAVSDRHIKLRIYVPDLTKPLAVMIYFHGGGHMVGSVELYDPICRRLAQTSQVIVVAVEYRLAPEHPYPSAINDGVEVCRNYQSILSTHQLSGKLIVAGDSAGGAMAATLAQRSQTDAQLQIDMQVLIYPSLDYSLSSQSYQDNGRGYLLETDKIRWYFSHYFQHNEDPKAVSPLFRPIDQRLPPTLILSAGFDPLRDEAHAYFDKLTSAQVTCEIYQFKHMIHAFINLDSLVPSQCQALYQRISRFVNNPS
ncbi:MAG: alpha/beta hydrolase [Gammaproteobacteria bacterium]|nr:alpha/beta hydrolase [Gammaproteobacteria bacterium]